MKKKKRRYGKDEVSALGSYMSMSADKARRVIDQIRGRSYEETLLILGLMPYRASYPILKLLNSAFANGIKNMYFDEECLIISKAEVNEGTTVKKLKPRARGRSYPIRRSTCHITIVLKDTSYQDYEHDHFGDYTTKETWHNVWIDNTSSSRILRNQKEKLEGEINLPHMTRLAPKLETSLERRSDKSRYGNATLDTLNRALNFTYTCYSCSALERAKEERR